VALDYFAELCEQLLPPHEPNEKFFRLLGSVLEHLRNATDAERANGPWLGVTYFTLWAVRLSGFLHDLRISDQSREIAKEMLITPIGNLQSRDWTRATAHDLRRALIDAVEHHIERRLTTASVLETL
jgi:DNA repair protein RecO (recombination protein O)